jgi:hypothetical protein
MSLVEYAQDELQRAGWFDKDSDYAGMVGPAVVEMMRQFAEEGHSGYSAHLVLHIFERLASYRPLTPLDNPMEKGEYHCVSEASGTPPMTTLQSLRKSSVFSEDSGKTWYDIDKKRTRWERITRSRRAYITFPYMPK